MKTLSIFIAGLFAVLTSSAQYGRQYSNNSTLTVSLSNPNQQVYIDGRNYSSGNSIFQLNNLTPGQHTIQVSNGSSGGGILAGIFGGGRNSGTTTAFNVQSGYDTQINVKNNGRVQVRETRSVAYQNQYNRRNRNRYDNNRNMDENDRNRSERDRDNR